MGLFSVTLATVFSLFTGNVAQNLPINDNAITIEELLGAPEQKVLPHQAPVPGQRYIPVLDLDSEISDETVGPLIDEIAKDNADHAEKIVIRINSPGGNVISGFKLSSAIERSDAPVICIVDMGMAASMAAYTLESCDERIMTKRSLLMFHSPSGGVQGQPDHVREFLKELDALDQVMAEQYARRTKMTYRQWRRKLDNDNAWWITWRTAMEYGIVDKIVDNGDEYVKQLKANPAKPS